MTDTRDASEPELAPELLPMENVFVGAVLVSAGALGVVLGLVRPDCTLEAGFGTLLLLLGLATFRSRRSS